MHINERENVLTYTQSVLSGAFRCMFLHRVDSGQVLRPPLSYIVTLLSIDRVYITTFFAELVYAEV